VIIFHDGWYYLLVTDRSACAGANSRCDIRIGRSRKVTGPFIDTMGIDMLQSGEELDGVFADYFELR
jgi:arabinan endo-1,5-alpha-L-arabinosidase